MGNKASTTTTTTTTAAVHRCLLSAVDGNSALVPFQNDLLYGVTAVHEYNLNFPVTPAAVTSQRRASRSPQLSTLGGADGAVVVDMKHFQQFSMDEATHVATIGPGLSLGDNDTLLYNAGGRAMSHGLCPEIRAGAAASFGIVTEFKVRTQTAPRGAIRYSYSFKLGSAAQRARLLADWQDFILSEDLNRKFTSDCICLQDNVILKGVFFGSKEEYHALGLEHRFPGSDSSKLLVLDDWLGTVTHVVDDLAVRLGGSMSSYFYAKSLGFTRDTSCHYQQ
ncbi:hypothetical protein SI65_09774 [Aspergillus cristatus]|uniref:Uncharacterized protein n=1 Tax=Aspergillus cristatus TaxID=573508 RepID=A0A1E3B1F7_ASPCR|nr:hypothetical protein SI65_09774 [Aspergillus cristatus]